MPRRGALRTNVGGVTRDPYRTLGIAPTATTEELHDAYRRLVKLHHPDRNGGSAEATRRFQDIQAAYEEIGRLRAARPAATQPRPPADDSIAARMADLEREVREAQAARAAAREAEAARGRRTATLQATEMGERVYTAVGFLDLGRFLEFVP